LLRATRVLRKRGNVGRIPQKIALRQQSRTIANRHASSLDFDDARTVPPHLPVLSAGSMLQCTPPFGIILKLLFARRAAFASAGQPMAAALRGFRRSAVPR
jgi:hypothetical protein